MPMSRKAAGVRNPDSSTRAPLDVLRGDGKTDARDAAIIADQARMRRDPRPLRDRDQIAVDLQTLTARRGDVAADRTRTINRLRAPLLEYFPALERVLNCPGHTVAKRDGIAQKPEQSGLVVGHSPRQQPLTLRVNHDAVMMCLPRVDTSPDLGHGHLRIRRYIFPADDLADASLHSDLVRASQSAAESSRITGRPFPCGHRLGGSEPAIPDVPGPSGPYDWPRSTRDQGKEAEALAGWLTFDLSQPREAVSRYKHALKLAAEAGDGPLTACTLNYWSYLLASQDKSAEAVEVLGKAGEYVRGSAATTQAWVSARQAEEAARVGDDGTAERALERAFTAYDYAPPQHERSWTSFFGASRLGSLAVSSYGRLGHSETDSLASSLLSALSPTETKVRALVVSDLALSAATRSDIDRADALAREAFPLAVRTEASLAQDRLLELTEVLPQGNGRDTADALRQQITSALLGSSQA